MHLEAFDGLADPSLTYTKFARDLTIVPSSLGLIEDFNTSLSGDLRIVEGHRCNARGRRSAFVAMPVENEQKLIAFIITTSYGFPVACCSVYFIKPFEVYHVLKDGPLYHKSLKKNEGSNGYFLTPAIDVPQNFSIIHDMINKAALTSVMYEYML